jgi:hypothetical protein
MDGAIAWSMRKLYGRAARYRIDKTARLVYIEDGMISYHELFNLAGVYLDDDGRSWSNNKGSYSLDFCPPN